MPRRHLPAAQGRGSPLRAEIDAYVVAQHDDVHPRAARREHLLLPQHGRAGRGRGRPRGPARADPAAADVRRPGARTGAARSSTARSRRPRSPPGSRRSGSSPGNTSSGCATCPTSTSSVTWPRCCPCRVISMVLGVPLEDVAKFREWSEEITSSVGHHGGDEARRQQVQERVLRLHRRAARPLGRRRRQQRAVPDRGGGKGGRAHQARGRPLHGRAARRREHHDHAPHLKQHRASRLHPGIFEKLQADPTLIQPSSRSHCAWSPRSRGSTGSPWQTPRSAAPPSPKGHACSCSTVRRTRTSRPGRTARTCCLTGRTPRRTSPSARARTPASAPRSPGSRAASWSSSSSSSSQLRARQAAVAGPVPGQLHQPRPA